MNNSSIGKQKYKNSDLAVIALYQLGGASRYIHLEDVALKAAELSPKAFSWKKYPEHPNLEAVRLALKNELEAKRRRVFGSIRDGWMLTPEGLSWCLAGSSITMNQSAVDQIHKEIARAKKTDAFAKIAANKQEETSDNELRVVLRIDEYFSPRNRRERAMALANAAVIDPQLRPILITLKQRGFIDLEVG